MRSRVRFHATNHREGVAAAGSNPLYVLDSLTRHQLRSADSSDDFIRARVHTVQDIMSVFSFNGFVLVVVSQFILLNLGLIS
jgi:hypothetical protein